MKASSQPARTITVPAERLVRWVFGFGERHGAVTATPTSDGFDLQAGDGAIARVSAREAAVAFRLDSGDGPAGADPGEPGEPRPVGFRGAVALAGCLADHLAVERELGLLVIRRGGYAAARLRGAAVVTSKVGTRYVQGRTAAGGWSQQRYARRRDNQTAALVEAAVDVAVRILAGPGDRPPEILVTGGDRALVDRALQAPALRTVAGLPRGPHLALGDPRADVVRAVPGMLRSARITVTEPVLGVGDGSPRKSPGFSPS